MTKPRPAPRAAKLALLKEGWQAWLWPEPESQEAKSKAPHFKYLLQILAIVGREFGRNLLLLRASVLTLTIVFALVPSLALGTAVLKGLGMDNQLRQAAYRFIAGLELQPAGPATPPLPATTDLHAHLQQAVSQIFNYVDRTNFTTLGGFGVGGLLLSLLSLLSGIDQAMNAIWHLQGKRRINRQLLKYLALLLLLPLSVNLALAMETALQNPASLFGLQPLLPTAWTNKFLLHLLPIGLLILTLTTLYRVLPNTRVNLWPALLGGASGGIFWLGSQALYLKLQFGVARYNAIYGSFATVPLFLLWLLIGWVVFLAGAEITFAIQHRRQYSRGRGKPTPLARMALACQVLLLVNHNHDHRQVTTIASLAARLSVRLEELRPLLANLIEQGLLRRGTARNESYLPLRPVAEIDPTQLGAMISDQED